MSIDDEMSATDTEPLTFEGRHRESRRRVSDNTAIFAIFTGLSRVVGLFRDSVASYLFGTSPAASAFTIASQIPNLMANLFAQAALSAAFVPVFADLLQQGKRREAFRLASTLFWIVMIVLGAITALGIVLAGVILPMLSGQNFDGHDAAVMTQIMFPVVLALGLTGVITGILQSYDEFSIPALAPVLWNLVIIAIMLGLRSSFGKGDGIYAYAVGWLIATVAQFVFVASALRRIDYRLDFHIDWRDPRIREVFVLMLPVTVGLGIINLDGLLNSSLGALVNTHPHGGGPRAIQLAFLVYMLPQGIFSVAVSTVLFPTLSRQAARRDASAMRHTIGNGMRQINLLLFPSAAGLLALATPIIRTLFEYHTFGVASLHLTSEALFWFAFSLPFAGLNLLMTRTFFALQRPWLPAKLSAINMAVDLIVSIGLYRPLGIAGLVIGTASANIVMAYLQWRRLRIGFNGYLEGDKTLMITARILAASVLTGLLARFVWILVNAVVGAGVPGRFFSLGIAIAVAGGFYLWAISRMRVPEWAQIESMLRRRLGF